MLQDHIDLANLIGKLPVGVAHSVAFVLADSLGLPKHARGTRMLELGEIFPEHGAELRSLAIRCGFDPVAYLLDAHRLAGTLRPQPRS